jgi:glycosyltransferase involved in cell wall biosynthesis
VTDDKLSPDAPGHPASGPIPLLVCLSKRWGGVDVRVLQVARALQARGHPYAVAVLAESPLHMAMEADGLAVHPIRRGRADPRIVADLCRLIRQTGATAIDAHNMQSQYWSALAAMRARVPVRVATVHSIYREEHPRAGRRQLHEYALHACRMAGFDFLTVSATVSDYLRKLGIADDRITLSWNGIERLDTPPPRLDLHEMTGWPADAVVLGAIGRLEPVKGLSFLVEALAGMVAAGDTRTHLLLVGTGREDARLRQQVRDSGLDARAHFAGFRKDVDSILASIDLFCLPSLSEGLPFSVLEAMRQGVPVLASRLDGPAALFRHGETIHFVPPGDVTALRCALEMLVSDPALRRRIGDAGRRFTVEHLSIDRVIADTLAAYGARRKGVDKHKPG